MVSNNYVSAIGLKRLSIDRSMIYEPDKEWMYSHHPYIIFFNNKFIAAWSNGLKDEDNPGQRVAFSISTDFIKWSKPRALATPSIYKKDTLNVLTAAGFHQFNDTLVAYFGEYSPHKTNTKLWSKTSIDGENWSEAYKFEYTGKRQPGSAKDRQWKTHHFRQLHFSLYR